MIEVHEAKTLILENCPPPKAEQVPLHKANGMVLAETVHSPVDTPPFHQSAMDGYAFSYGDWDEKSDLLISGEVQAGNCFNDKVNPFETIRIFTGAALPQGTDTVVIQENVVKNDSRISIKDDKLKKGSNVRLKGAQTKEGSVALTEGHLLTPASISFLAGIGIDKVKVYSNPVVEIIVTGKELIMPGDIMNGGGIYESNSFGLAAALQHLNIFPASIAIVDDDEEKIKEIILKKINADMLILTGGVSVGDYDFVASSLEKCGVKKIFHKVKQKPGKPFYFGVHGTKLVLGLPGNPASVLTCFYEYVVDAISKQTKKEYFKTIQMPLANDYSKKAGLTFFLKGKINSDSVVVLNDQESYKMNSFAMADCLIELEEEKEQFFEGDMVSVRMII